MRETWREWVISWAKAWGLFVGLWIIVALGAVLWCVAYRPPEDECAP
jgi:hypothetical protein